MIDPDDYRQRAEALSGMLHERLGVAGKGPAERLARAGRRLPRAERRAAREIAAAGRRMDHPKLARLSDPGQLDTAFTGLTGWLRRIDPVERRRTAALRLAAAVVANLALAGLCLAAVLRWRGLI